MKKSKIDSYILWSKMCTVYNIGIFPYLRAKISYYTHPPEKDISEKLVDGAKIGFNIAELIKGNVTTLKGN